MRFYKWHGAGNDFVIVVSPKETFTTKNIAQICHRRFGIGGDGFIIIRKVENYDFAMEYYNADGRLGSLCGNGSRCAVALAAHLGWIKHSCCFLASDGPHHACITKNDTPANHYTVELEMHPVYVVQKIDNSLFIDTGSPHLVVFRDNITEIDVLKEGKHFRNLSIFAENGGVNVNFVEITGENTIALRTYERGVEDETWACGTGVTAAALATSRYANYPNGKHSIAAKAQGGQFTITFQKSEEAFEEILLIGPAQLVFEGKQ